MAETAQLIAFVNGEDVFVAPGDLFSTMECEYESNMFRNLSFWPDLQKTVPHLTFHFTNLTVLAKVCYYHTKVLTDIVSKYEAIVCNSADLARVELFRRCTEMRLNMLLSRKISTSYNCVCRRMGDLMYDRDVRQQFMNSGQSDAPREHHKWIDCFLQKELTPIESVDTFHLFCANKACQEVFNFSDDRPTFFALWPADKTNRTMSQGELVAIRYFNCIFRAGNHALADEDPLFQDPECIDGRPFENRLSLHEFSTPSFSAFQKYLKDNTVWDAGLCVMWSSLAENTDSFLKISACIRVWIVVINARRHLLRQSDARPELDIGLVDKIGRAYSFVFLEYTRACMTSVCWNYMTHVCFGIGVALLTPHLNSCADAVMEKLQSELNSVHQVYMELVRVYTMTRMKKIPLVADIVRTSTFRVPAALRVYKANIVALVNHIRAFYNHPFMLPESQFSTTTPRPDEFKIMLIIRLGEHSLAISKASNNE